MNVTHEDLDKFVEKSDSLGGPGGNLTLGYWSDFHYIPTASVDTSLDPDSDSYFSQMLGLYEEISGRKIDQKTTELTDLNVDDLVDRESPYGFQEPAQRAVHYLRLAKAIQTANLPRSARVLDMGCGWGLSSELLAQMGFDVLAVDINPLFVELVRRRARRLNLKIDVTESSFDGYFTETKSVDAVLFYESFHHVTNPRRILEPTFRTKG